LVRKVFNQLTTTFYFLQAFTCSLSLTAKYGDSLGYALILATVWQSWGEQWAGQ